MDNDNSFTVTYKGQELHVSKYFMGNPLTDDDIKRLKANMDSGKPVVIKETSKKGKPYKVKAKLGVHTYKDRKIFGVIKVGFVENPKIAAWRKKKASRPTATVDGKQVKFSPKVYGKPVSHDVLAVLCKGKTATIPMTSKKGKPYKIKGKVGKCSYNGHDFYGIKDLGFAD